MSLQDLKISNLFDVKGKIALVTGGGSGLGKMIASALVVNGATVYIAARKENQLRATADELNAIGTGRCHFIAANLGSKAGCEALIAEFRKRESKLHVLVNNSGVTWGAPFNDFPEKEGWDRVMALNVKAIFYMTAGLSELLAKDATNTEPGRVINISSVAGVSADAEASRLAEEGSGLWSYHTSKAAVNHLTSQLAVKLSDRHITVNAILPGVFPSRMTAWGIQSVGEDTMGSTQASGRLGRPADIGGLTLLLCSPAGSYITGQQIILDGGTTIVFGKLTPENKL